MRGCCVGGRVRRLIHLATRSTPKNNATATGTHAIQTTRRMSHHLTRDSILVEAVAGRRARVRDLAGRISAVGSEALILVRLIAARPTDRSRPREVPVAGA